MFSAVGGGQGGLISIVGLICSLHTFYQNLSPDTCMLNILLRFDRQEEVPNASNYIKLHVNEEGDRSRNSRHVFQTLFSTNREVYSSFLAVSFFFINLKRAMASNAPLQKPSLKLLPLLCISFHRLLIKTPHSSTPKPPRWMLRRSNWILGPTNPTLNGRYFKQPLSPCTSSPPDQTPRSSPRDPPKADAGAPPPAAPP